MGSRSQRKGAILGLSGPLKSIGRLLQCVQNMAGLIKMPLGANLWVQRTMYQMGSGFDESIHRHGAWEVGDFVTWVSPAKWLNYWDVVWGELTYVGPRNRGWGQGWMSPFATTMVDKSVVWVHGWAVQNGWTVRMAFVSWLMWPKKRCIRWHQGGMNLFTTGRGDTAALRPFLTILWSLVITIVRLLSDSDHISVYHLPFYCCLQYFWWCVKY